MVKVKVDPRWYTGQMAASFFFYDLETSGFDPRRARIMQFAGQRTDMNLKPIGEPVNILIKLTPDVLPDPDAVLITKITPQQTLADGMTEAEFLEFFYKEVVIPNTTFLGYNSIRFDDEFMRFLHYRNFYDPYEWQWANGCSRWDILDLVRMTRALRPAGIEWPFAPDGKPTNRLEFLTKVNGLDHEKAHDALNDVFATIAVAKLIRDTQPDLFDYLLTVRDKKAVAEKVQSGQPFVYTTGRYSSQYLHTSVAMLLVDHPESGALVYDLRFDPSQFIKMSVDQLVEAWRFTRDPAAVRLPVKTMKFNRCPAIAPPGVLFSDPAAVERLDLTKEMVETHRRILKAHQATFANSVLKAVARLDQEREKTQVGLVDNELTVDSRLYDGFFPTSDKHTMRAVRAADSTELSDYKRDFKDDRLKGLLPLYKARNYPAELTSEEASAWEAFREHRLLDGGKQSWAAKYFARLAELAEAGATGEKQYLLEELQLYGQAILPADAAG